MNVQRAHAEMILDQCEPRWRAQGYEVVRQPATPLRPPFLHGYVPDAILVGKEPKIIVAVLQKGNEAVAAQLQRLRELVARQPDWRLDVVYAGPAEPIYRTVPHEAITETLRAARYLVGVEPRSALLLFWSALEAIGRHLSPDLNDAGQGGPGRLLEMLAGEGYVTPSEADLLRQSMRQRNRIAHGELDLSPDRETFATLLSIADSLASSISGDVPPR